MYYAPQKKDKTGLTTLLQSRMPFDDDVLKTEKYMYAFYEIVYSLHFALH